MKATKLSTTLLAVSMLTLGFAALAPGAAGDGENPDVPGSGVGEDCSAGAGNPIDPAAVGGVGPQGSWFAPTFLKFWLYFLVGDPAGVNEEIPLPDRDLEDWYQLQVASDPVELNALGGNGPQFPLDPLNVRIVDFDDGDCTRVVNEWISPTDGVHTYTLTEPGDYRVLVSASSGAGHPVPYALWTE